MKKVEVQDSGTQLDVTASGNASSVVSEGQRTWMRLSDDPDELQSELQSAGRTFRRAKMADKFTLDGFTGGQLPPKSSIREVRINQNPFSAEYDHLGFGRIEVFTKPGTDKYHGQFMVNGNTAGLLLMRANSVFPGTAPQPGYDSQFLQRATFGGPLGKKKLHSFSISAAENIEELSVINTPALDANLKPDSVHGFGSESEDSHGN